MFAHLVGVRGAVERRRAERGERGGADSVDVGAGRLGGAAVLGDARVCETLLAACKGSERNERTDKTDRYAVSIRTRKKSKSARRMPTGRSSRKIEQGQTLLYSGLYNATEERNRRSDVAAQRSDA